MVELQTEKIHCIHCGGQGKVPHWTFWQKDCPLCEGKGVRLLIMDASFPEHIKAQARHDAAFNMNLARRMGPFERLCNDVANLFF